MVWFFFVSLFLVFFFGEGGRWVFFLVRVVGSGFLVFDFCFLLVFWCVFFCFRFFRFC